MKTKIETTFSRLKLKDDILREARVAKIPAGFAEKIADEVSRNIEKWLDNRPVVTKKSFDLAVIRELKKYHPDLAYIFENRNFMI
ncbi:hypothetical protein IJG76_00800 [Candidatus Saccharibacteria bacterium]|nr:hypothetical protein [Candidatus Saccharibacteria bacterium]